MKASIPRPHLSNATRCLPLRPRKVSPTSPIFPSSPLSKSRRSFNVRDLLRDCALVESTWGSKYSSKPTRFHGLWDKKDVYCLKRPSSIRFAVANPSNTAAESPPSFCKPRKAASAAASTSIDKPCKRRMKGSGPEVANSMRRRPDHLHVNDPVSFFKRSLSSGNLWDELRKLLCQVKTTRINKQKSRHFPLNEMQTKTNTVSFSVNPLIYLDRFQIPDYSIIRLPKPTKEPTHPTHPDQLSGFCCRMAMTPVHPAT